MFPLYCLSYASLKGCQIINLQSSGLTLNNICAVKMKGSPFHLVNGIFITHFMNSIEMKSAFSP